MQTVEFDGDYKVTTTKTPRFRIFDLGDGSDNSTPENAGTSEAIKEYEALLLKMSDGEFCQKIGATSSWGPDGRYRVQVHWYDVTEDRVLRPDTDFEGQDEARGQDGKKGDVQPGDEPSDSKDGEGSLGEVDRSRAITGEDSVGSDGDREEETETDLKPAEN